VETKIREGSQENNRDKDQKQAWDGPINAGNITPDTPEELWGTLALMALDQITEVSETVEEVIGRSALWDKGNNPHLPVEFLMSKTFWSLRHWKPSLE